MRASVILSALVAAMVGFGGTVALIVAAAQATGADAGQTSSWVTALCLSMAATSAYLSVKHRIPIITAWSTPGAALIADTAGTIGFEAAIGAFLFAGLLVLVTAAFNPVGVLVDRIPASIAAAMLAGVLIRFATAIFEHAETTPALVLPLVGIFLLARLASPAGAVLVVLAAGLAMTFGLGWDEEAALDLDFATLQFIVPSFDPAVLLGLGVPLYLVTMASQNLPGFAVLRAAGYTPPTRSILAVTGLASILTAPFGAHASNLAAITASICTGPDTHPDPEKRWLTGPVYAVAYLFLAAFGASSVALIAAMPAALVATVAGVALLAPLANALGAALGAGGDRLAATLTLAVTASGMTLAGIGSAFWGLAAGLLALALQAGATRFRERRAAAPRDSVSVPPKP